MSQVVMISLWRNDVRQELAKRVRHLLNKKGVARWVWVVGDCEDDTAVQLHKLISGWDKDITLIHFDTHIDGDEPRVRLKRLSQTVNVALDAVGIDDDYVVIHESDLITPDDIVEQFLETGLCPIAGWVTLNINGQEVFYDTWAYRAYDPGKGVCMFQNHAPYHYVYNAREIFEVASVGSCWMLHAEDVRAGVRCEQMGCLELCEKLKARGRHFWVDPLIPVIQPTHLWTSQQHA